MPRFHTPPISTEMASRLFNETQWSLSDIEAGRTKEAIYRLNFMLDVLHVHLLKRSRRF